MRVTIPQTPAGSSVRRQLAAVTRMMLVGLMALAPQLAWADDPQPIVIGMVEPYTGEEASYGQWADDALALAMEQHGDTIAGRKITVVRADSKCEPSVAVSAGRQVLAAHPAILLAPVCSGDTLAMIPMIKSNQVPTLSDNIAPKVTQEGAGWVWRVQITDPVVTGPEAKYIMSQGYKRIAVIHDTSAPGQANSQNMIDALTAVAPPVEVATYNLSDVDYSGPLLKLKAANPDAVYVEAYEVQGARLLTQARQLGFTMPIYGNFSLFDDTFIKAAGSVGNGLLGATTYTADWSDAARKFDAQWFAKFHYHSNADIAALYEMAIAALTALDKAPDARGTALNEVVKHTDIPDLPMGALSFDDTGNNANPLVLLVTWENEQIKILKVLAGH
jgi:branched-chain amino acid transport system substrate-binding protein